MHQIMTPAQRGRWIVDGAPDKYLAELQRLDAEMEATIETAGKIRDGNAWLLREFPEMYGQAVYSRADDRWIFETHPGADPQQLREGLRTFPFAYTVW